MLPRVIAVEVLDNKTLLLTFDNNEVRSFNVASYLHYPVYNSLNSPAFFSAVKVLNGTVVWDDTIDFAPETLYLESEPIEKRISTIR